MSLEKYSDQELIKELNKRKDDEESLEDLRIRKIKEKASVMLSNPNFNNLKEAVLNYVEFIQSDEFHEDNDYDRYICEEAINAFYGKEFWDWYNKIVC